MHLNSEYFAAARIRSSNILKEDDLLTRLVQTLLEGLRNDVTNIFDLIGSRNGHPRWCIDCDAPEHD